MQWIQYFTEDIGDQSYVRSLLNKTPYDKIWLTTDWHIYKDEYNGKKQSLLELKRLVVQQKLKVKPSDIFIYMGDLSYKKLSDDYDEQIRNFYNQLNGIKILIKGNHDIKEDDYYLSLGFNYVFDTLEFKDIIFSHRPVSIENLKNIKYNIHGHIHGFRIYSDVEKENHLDCWTDSHSPINLKDLLNKAEKFNKENIDTFNSNDFNKILEKNKNAVRRYEVLLLLFFSRFPQYKNLDLKEMYKMNYKMIQDFVCMPEVIKDEELVGWRQTKMTNRKTFESLPYIPTTMDKYEHTVILNKDSEIIIDPCAALIGQPQIYTNGYTITNFHYQVAYGFGYTKNDGLVSLKEFEFPQNKFDKILKKKGIPINEEYEPPMSLKEIKQKYGDNLYNKLKSDPVHKWRAETGIELIHKEPSKEELERIMRNWESMDDRRKRLSDKKSMEVFGCNNIDNYNNLIKTYNESINSEIYYRFEYEGIGIYEAWKNNISINKWKAILNSGILGWLPKPTFYGNNNRSYFTERGYNEFMKKTYPLIIKDLDKNEIKISKHHIDERDILYKDEYQIITKDIINETLETTFTRPFLPNMVTLYHSDNKKLKYIDPGKGIINVGTKLSNPRYSSWWCRDPFFCIVFTGQIQRVFYKMLKYEDKKQFQKDSEKYYCPDVINKKLYVNKDYKQQLLNYDFNSLKHQAYLYTVTVPKSKVGRGHNIDIDEYTLDEIIKPDKCQKITFRMYLPYIEWVDGTHIKLLNKKLDPMNNRQTYNPTIMDKLIYYDRTTRKKKGKEFKKMQKEINQS